MTITMTSEAARPDLLEGLPYTGPCPAFCHGRHHRFVTALDDYHHQALGYVDVSLDPVECAGADPVELPDSVTVQVIQHVTRDRDPYVAIDDSETCLRFTPEQARALAARLLQGAQLLDGVER